MKHAFLIGAYKNPLYLESLINSLDSEKSNIYVHVNAESWIQFKYLATKYQAKSNVHFLHDIKVLWGGCSLLQSIILLIRSALQEKDNQVFHLITGQDILIKPLSELFAFFDGNPNNYLSWLLPNDDIYSFENGGLGRYNYYLLFDTFNCRNPNIFTKLNHIVLMIQRSVGFHRSEMKITPIYGGSSWWSLQRNALEYFITTYEQLKLGKRLAHTFAPDEMIFQTILLNSSKGFKLVNDNLRYMVWKAGAPGPKTLMLEDFVNITKSSAFFARKVDPEYSAELILKINSFTNDKNKCNSTCI